MITKMTIWDENEYSAAKESMYIYIDTDKIILCG